MLLQRVRGLIEILEIRQRTAAGQRFHSANACGKGSIGDDLEYADVAGAIHVAAAAEFSRPVTGGDNANAVAVLLAEHRDRAALLCIRDRHGGLGDLDVLTNFFVDEILNGFDLRLGQRLVIGVVESQTIGCDKRSRLLHGVAEDIFQCLMQQMRRGVIGSCIEARRFGDGCANRCAMGQVTFVDSNSRHDEFTDRLLCIDNGGASALPLEGSGIADLSAGLGIERRRRQSHVAFAAVMEYIALLAVDDDRLHDRRHIGVVVVADELGRPDFFGDSRERRGIGRRLKLRRRFRLCARARHHRFEAFPIERHALLFRQFADQIHRNAVGVVKAEDFFARNRPLAARANFVK